MLPMSSSHCSRLLPLVAISAMRSNTWFSRSDSRPTTRASTARICSAMPSSSFSAYGPRMLSTMTGISAWAARSSLAASRAPCAASCSSRVTWRISASSPPVWRPGRPAFSLGRSFGFPPICRPLPGVAGDLLPHGLDDVFVFAGCAGGPCRLFQLGKQLRGEPDQLVSRRAAHDLDDIRLTLPRHVIGDIMMVRFRREPGRESAQMSMTFQERHQRVQDLIQSTVQLRRAAELIKHAGYCPHSGEEVLPEGHSIWSALRAVAADDHEADALVCQVAGFLLMT